MACLLFPGFFDKMENGMILFPNFFERYRFYMEIIKKNCYTNKKLNDTNSKGEGKSALINEWMIGNVIKKLRESRGIKQSQLCQGLCSVATLCKFENGERELDYFLVSAFMQRLGYGLDKYEFYGSSEEWVQWEQMYTINQIRQEKQVEKLRDTFDDYRDTWKDNIEKNRIQKQFVTWLEGILEKWAGHYEKAKVLFQTAISYTVPDWEKAWKEKSVVSVRELDILTEL